MLGRGERVTAGFIKSLLDAAKSKVKAAQDGGLSEPFRRALALVKQQDAIQNEILNLDTDTDVGRARRDQLQHEMTQVCEAQEREGLVKECGKIIGLVVDADDPDVTIESLTEDGLAVLIAAGR